jgi:23S rRNA (cytosine1962-C5)-methyltransferase
MVLLSPQYFTEYELIDSGNYEKLERFGKFILARPEPQAVWEKLLSKTEWNNMANSRFEKKKGNETDNNEKGEWILKKGMAEQWFVNYQYKEMKIRMRLGLTAFKHVGIFPEQTENWNYIYDSIQNLKIIKPRVLNLFAYTGGASLAAKAAGADVVHVDSVKQVINWSKENMEASGLKDIRWVVEDAMKFIRREEKRGNTYHGIILDPPKYGRGPDGEKWHLEDGINELISLCSKLLEKESNFFILNLYSMGFSPLIADNLVKNHFTDNKSSEYGELFVPDRAGRRLPLGIFIRFSNFIG